MLNPYVRRHIYNPDEIKTLLNESCILLTTNVQLCEEMINEWTEF
jgi:hypothetical protein